MILLIDNYDSFTYNLYQYIGIFNSDIKVVRNDKITIDEITAMDPERIVLSPGPKNPKEAGICMDVVWEFTGKKPILGICLGHQCIGEALGGWKQCIYGNQFSDPCGKVSFACGTGKRSARLSASAGTDRRWRDHGYAS